MREGQLEKRAGLYIADNIAHIRMATTSVLQPRAHIALNASSHELFPAIMFHRCAKQPLLNWQVLEECCALLIPGLPGGQTLCHVSSAIPFPLSS